MKVLVGHQACLGQGGGHTTWTCRTCDQTVYGPALNTHCTALDGPGTVRISNARSKIPRGGRLIGSLLVEDEVFDGPGHFTLLPVISTMTFSPLVECEVDRMKNLSGPPRAGVAAEFDR